MQIIALHKIVDYPPKEMTQFNMRLNIVDSRDMLEGGEPLAPFGRIGHGLRRLDRVAFFVDVAQSQVDPVELLEVQLCNSVAPFILVNRLRPAMEASSLEQVGAAIAAGLGIGFLPEKLAEEARYPGTLQEIPIRETLPIRKLNLIESGSRILPPAALAVISLLKNR